MQREYLDLNWEFFPGLYDVNAALRGKTGRKVDLPHDAMIEMTPAEHAPAGAAMGYHEGSIASYTKKLNLPPEWEGEDILLKADGVMHNAWVDLDGNRIALHHYGYTPFTADLTPYAAFGGENRVTVTCDTMMQPNSRWYSGTGVLRHIELLHGPKLHVSPDGIYARAERIETNPDGTKTAYMIIEVTVKNSFNVPRMAEVAAAVSKEDGTEALTRSVRIEVQANGEQTARLLMTYENPHLWDAEHPNLYKVTASVQDLGRFVNRPDLTEAGSIDKDSVLFGFRTVTADAKHGLRINGQEVLLKGGCVHHDNGILGAVSLFDAEWRKASKLKSLGYNAIRTAHNPPSKILLEVCDRIGLYVIDEAFDAWRMEKQPGDYSQYFDRDWQDDIAAYVKRDRNEPCVIIWSTGNEIPERGGLSDGYLTAAALAAEFRRYDRTRPVTNALCTYWNGLPDEKQREVTGRILKNNISGEIQNAAESTEENLIETYSEAFAAPLDIVGYNYMDEFYEKDGKLYPERVIVGTETFPMNIDRCWALVKKLPYVIGDFTWTCYDYLGEAGIGKSVLTHPGEEKTHDSLYPWRHANDSDFNLNGELMPQGCYREIVWGSEKTALFVQDPVNFGLDEYISRWGWPAVEASYSFPGQEGKPIHAVVYSKASEVELFLNGSSLGRKPAGEAERFTAPFDFTYEPGVLKAVSYENGAAVSEDILETTGEPAAIRLVQEKYDAPVSDGQYLTYIRVEIVDDQGRIVPYAKEKLEAVVTGEASLAAFGSGDPVSADNYVSGMCRTFRGTALLILRSTKKDAKFDVKIVKCGE